MPTRRNLRKPRKANNKLTNIYQSDQLECIQRQLSTGRNSIEDRQS